MPIRIKREDCQHLPDPELLRAGGLYWCSYCRAFFHVYAFEGFFGAYDRAWKYATKPRMFMYWILGRVLWSDIWKQ